MRLQLTDTIFVTSDSHQYILKEQKVGESNNPYEVVLGYYGTIKCLVRGLIEKEIKNDSVSSLKALKEKIDKLEISITKQIEKELTNHV